MTSHFVNAACPVYTVLASYCLTVGALQSSLAHLIFLLTSYLYIILRKQHVLRSAAPLPILTALTSLLAAPPVSSVF